MLEKCMSFSINNKSNFIDSFQFLSSKLDSLVKNFGEHDSKYMSQEFDSKVLDLVKQKRLYPYEYMILQSLKRNCKLEKHFIVL